MKRDDDYIRELLLELESSEKPFMLAGMTLSPTPEQAKRHMHALWLADAGLFLEVNDGVFRITNQGHDYLAVIRSDTIWNKTKASAARVGGVTLSMMKDIAVGLAKQELAKLGLPVG